MLEISAQALNFLQRKINSILVNVRATVTCFQFFFQFYFKTNRQTAGSRTTNKNMYTGYADKSKQTI